MDMSMSDHVRVYTYIINKCICIMSTVYSFLCLPIYLCIHMHNTMPHDMSRHRTACPILASMRHQAGHSADPSRPVFLQGPTIILQTL